MVNFIYLAHSQDRYRRQTVFSVLSLLEYLQKSDLDHRVIVYTDKPAFFSPLRVETVLLEANQITEWTEKIDYIHRAKICLALDTASRFSGRLLTLDSDNCFISDPTEFLSTWSEDTVIMDKLEYLLGKPADLVGKKYKRFFKKNTFLGDENCQYEVTMQQECWNSGVLGLPESARSFLPHSLAVCDNLHTRFRKHISEQLATSIVMRKHFKIVSFRKYTYHWFGYGQAINHIINDVLATYPKGNLDDWIEAVSGVKQAVLQAPLNRDKMPWYKRWLSK